MKVTDFQKKNLERWSEYDDLLENAEKKEGLSPQELAQLPEMLQQQCADLSLARYRMYGANVCEHLNQQVLKGHKIVYKKTGKFFSKILVFIASDFPRKVREEWRLHIISWLFFLVPGLCIYFAVKSGNVEWARAILGELGMANMDSMYGEGSSVISSGRQNEGANFKMFAHYVNNNIGIDFQIFAGGILFGIGTIFFLVYNALFFGAAASYVEVYGDPQAFYGFVSGHASYELWAMIISGMAGLRVGLALLLPGRMTRGLSVKKASKSALVLIMGAALMTFFAACVEGFWSAQLVPFKTKVYVGYAGWILCILYFTFCGRGGLKSEA